MGADGTIYILEFAKPYVRTPKHSRPHPDDICMAQSGTTAFFAKDDEEAERKASEFLSEPLVWAGVRRYTQKVTLYPAPDSIGEYDIGTGSVPISSLD